MSPTSWTDLVVLEVSSRSSSYHPSSATIRLCKRIALGCALTAIVIGLLVTLTDVWEYFDPAFTNQSIWDLVQGKYQEGATAMALTTALSFGLCGIGLLISVAWRSSSVARNLARLCAALVLVWSGYVLAAFVCSPYFTLPTDRDLPKPFGVPPMSPFTAANFLCTSFTLLSLLGGSGRLVRPLASLGVSIIVLGNVLSLIGYAYGVELKLGLKVTPMALMTVSIFFVLTAGLICALGPLRFPLRPFVGSSVRPLLLRSILPVVVGLLLLDAGIRGRIVRSHRLSESAATASSTEEVQREQRALYQATLCLVTVVLTTVMISIVSTRIGAQIELAEARRDLALHRMAEVIDDLELTRQRVQEANAKLQLSNEDLARARDEAQAAVQAKTMLLAKVNHELRTPLTSIDLSIALLLSRVEKNKHGEYLRILRILEEKTHYLTRLINDIIDHAKLELRAVQIKVVPFDLDELIQDVLETMRPMAEKAGNHLELRRSPNVDRVLADPQRLKQCLLNLLGNSNKFTSNGILSLEIAPGDLEGQPAVLFRVADTGPGMTEEQQQRLFQPFVEVAGSDQKNYRGAGLGLVISRELCRLMKGELILERSNPGEGSTFLMRLPVRQTSSAPTPHEIHLPPVGSSQDVILVVDDDTAVRDLLGRLLRQEGFEVVSAATGQEALERARQVLPQAITLDVLLPDVDGWSVLSQLKAHPATARIPVIMLSVLGEEQASKALGALDALPKPFNPARLLELLRATRQKRGPGIVLVVADDPATRQLFHETLEDDGWSVVEASNGREAQQCMAREVPSLIILDLLMPEMDGFSLLSELQRHEGWEEIPVLVVTGMDLGGLDAPAGGQLVGGCIKGVLHKGNFDMSQLQKTARAAIKRG